MAASYERAQRCALFYCGTGKSYKGIAGRGFAEAICEVAAYGVQMLMGRIFMIQIAENKPDKKEKRNRRKEDDEKKRSFFLYSFY